MDYSTLEQGHAPCLNPCSGVAIHSSPLLESYSGWTSYSRLNDDLAQLIGCWLSNVDRFRLGLITDFGGSMIGRLFLIRLRVSGNFFHSPLKPNYLSTRTNGRLAAR